MNTDTARAADEYRANLGHDVSMLDAEDSAYLDTEVVESHHCPGCRCPREVPKVREVVRKVGKRVVRKTWCGPYQI